MHKFQNQGIGPTAASDIIKLCEGHHYQIACKRHFDVLHPNNKWEDSGTMHPSTYFKESERYYEEKNPDKKKEEKKPVEGAGVSKNLVV
jgi:hypothetical protein